MKKLCAIVILLLWCGRSVAQNFTNRGKDFWTGYGLHLFMEPPVLSDPGTIAWANTQEMVLYLSAEEDADVTVTIQGRSAVTVLPYHVKAGTVVATAPMPKASAADCRLYEDPPPFGNGGDGLFHRSIHIQSNVPVVAYAHISGLQSSGATMLMPVESWGYVYKAINSQQKVNGVANGCFSWIFVVADHDNTVVEITPSVPLRNGKKAGEVITATLNKGDIYQIVGAPINGSTGQDLTGTKVRSVANGAGDCFPIGVFSGSSLTAITCDGSNNGAGDNLIQQAFPVHAWGKRYLTAPFSTSDDAAVPNPSLFRVAVDDPATIVKKNGKQLTGLVRGFYYEYLSSTADYIEADKPVMITQYMPSMDQVTGCGYKGLGDPEMVYLSPVEQAINQVGFYRNTEAIVEVNYLTLVIPNKGVESLTIDGSKDFSHTYPHPNLPGYTVVIKRWPASKAQCIVKSDSSFTATTYGLGRFDSYAYNAGTRINNLNGSLSLHNTEGEAGAAHAFTCAATPVQLAVLMSYQPVKMVWHVSQLEHVTPRVDVTQDNPVPAETVVRNGITYYRYVLPDTYLFDATGNFRLTVSTTHPGIANCNNTEHLLLDVPVKPRPQAVFTYTHTGCIADPVTLNWKEASAGSSFEITRWNWTFADNSTDAGKSVQKLFTELGTQHVKLRVVSKEGCVGDTVQPVLINKGPVIDLAISPAIICEGNTVTLTTISPPGSEYTLKNWYWDFGNGTTRTTTTGEINDLVYKAQDQPYTIKVIGKVSETCKSDTVFKTVTVNRAPKAVFTATADICAGGEATFTDNSEAAAGAAITKWNWALADNTTLVKTDGTAFKHTYAGAGTFKVAHTVTDAKGCVSDTAWQQVVAHRFPVADFTLPSRVCMPGNAVVINNSTGEGALTYKWLMGDNSTALTARDASHAYATAGNYTVQLTVTSAYNCAATASKLLPVTAFGSKPVATFTLAPEEVCQGREQRFTDGSTATAGTTINSWKWDFADGSAAAQRNPAHTYSSAGTYQVKLVVTDAAGCASDTAIHPAKVNVQPTVSTEGRILALKNKEVLLRATANTTSGVSFAWTPAGELTGANTLSPVYVATRDQVFTITATSNEGGCTAVAALEVKVLVKIAPPNIFTPNGDGVNDNWVIEGLSDYAQCQVQVFNRYGQKVYSSQGYGQAWNGTLNGAMLPSGTYYYIITDNSSDWKRLTGSVTIIR